MTRRRASTDTRQIDLFAPAPAATGDAAFAGIEAWAAAAVGTMLKEDARSREEIAGAVSALLADEVSRFMLDAYASPARDGHNISFGRAIALMAACQHRAMIEEAVHRLGGHILWDEEIYTARMGHLQAQRNKIDQEMKRLRGIVQPIERGRKAGGSGS